ncbi:MAG: D-alanine--D-alanine ligase B [Planctomycetes bacterium ADurb.Bin126]|nr:MAG: D-alanine--D-alanine ligase B [Planctomycetes bacterium ADurb.Bin126]HOD80756.1 D-alanine--D-alanine ligase [Phycisphaerae bacterium]HQL71750.1 D-alanine--D-alanine ligase [Phycisphaerae bacterium]
MRVGLTYDLKDEYLAAGYSPEDVAELDKVETIDGIDNALRELGHQTERIGSVRRLLECLGEGKRWDIVFNIAEGLAGLGRESQVPTVLEIYGIPYTFSDPVTLGISLHKGMAKRVMQSAGIATPAFAEVRDEADIDPVDLPYPLFAKPLAEGSGKGISSKSRVNNKRELRELCLDLLTRFRQPVLVETFLPGREFTVGVTGTGRNAECPGMMEVVFRKDKTTATNQIYGQFTKDNYDDLVDYVPVREPDVARSCEELALAAWRVLGGRDAGRVDVRFDGHGIANFIEVNPLPGLNYIHSDLPILCKMNGISFTQLIGRIVESAATRVRPA